MALGYNGEGNIIERRTNTDPAHPDYPRDYALDLLRHACKYAAITLKGGREAANEHFKLMATEALKDLRRIRRMKELEQLIADEEL